jgi:hypothetical protein
MMRNVLFSQLVASIHKLIYSHRYAGNLPGTPGFWQSRKDELLNLCEQSPPHIWFTLSAADLFWWDLKQMLPVGSKPSMPPGGWVYRNEDGCICEANLGLPSRVDMV